MCEYVCIPYGLTIDGRNEGEYDRRERVVRCRDCVHGRKGEPLKCTRFLGIGDCLDVPVLAKVEPDGFCAWGKERDA